MALAVTAGPGVSAALAIFALSEFALLAGADDAGNSTGAFNPEPLTGLLETPVAGAGGEVSLVAEVLASGVVGAGAPASGAGAAAVTGSGAPGLAGGLTAGLSEVLAAGSGIKSMATLGVAAATVGSSTPDTALGGLRSTSIAGVADRMRPSSPR